MSLIHRLQVDTSELDKGLKAETNVAQKISQMILDVQALSDSLENFPVLIKGDKDELKVINRDIKELDAKIQKTSTKYDQYFDAFKTTSVQRINNFNNCLQVMNKEISKFCQVALNGTVTAEIKPIDEIEPYLNKVQYFWRSSNGEESLNETSNNILAALAFFLGILK
jgi:hypothetical protein